MQFWDRSRGFGTGLSFFPKPIPTNASPAGLSPRLRGNPVEDRVEFLCRRSIPAPAGEPLAVKCGLYAGQVYPRACGGTDDAVHPADNQVGLSPHLRGNLCAVRYQVRRVGSIPAPAGEPSVGRQWGCRWGVYPRACGGTCGELYVAHHVGGLSPHIVLKELLSTTRSQYHADHNLSKKRPRGYRRTGKGYLSREKPPHLMKTAGSCGPGRRPNNVGNTTGPGINLPSERNTTGSAAAKTAKLPEKPASAGAAPTLPSPTAADAKPAPKSTGSILPTGEPGKNPNESLTNKLARQTQHSI